MAVQTGLTRYQGSMGGIRHFKIKGLSGDYAAFVTPISGDRIKKSPEFVRTRENMNEFSGCGIACSSLRMGLSPLLTQMADRYVTSRLTALMKKINLQNQTDARGFRAIEVSLYGKNMLKDFEFNDKVTMKSLIKASMSFTHSENRDSAQLTVAPFPFDGGLSVPGGATHYRLLHVVSLLSDFAYNESTEYYEPLSPELNEQMAIAYSDYLPVNANVTEPIVMTVEFDDMAGLSMAPVACIQSVGIEFVQKVNDSYILLRGGSAMKIADVY